MTIYIHYTTQFCFLCLKDRTFNNPKKTGLNNAIIDITEV